MTPIMMAHYPDGSSIQQLLHYFQLTRRTDGQFVSYDFGRFGVPTPYNVANVKIPSYVYYGQNDLAVNYVDVIRLSTVFPNTKQLRKVANDKWTHVDFLFGIDAKELVYDNILIDLYENLS